MSDDTSLLLGLTVQQLIRWSIVLLILIAGFGSLIEGGALSREYTKTPAIIIFSAVVLGYMLIVGVMFFIGMNPNKFELVFIPLLFIGMILLALSFTNSLPEGDTSNGNIVSITSSSTLDDLPITNLSTNQTFASENSESSTPMDNTQVQLILQTIGSLFLILLVLIGLITILYVLVRRQTFDPDIQITTVNEYKKPRFQSNLSIIEDYIQASNLIERLKGKAPEWFSPTFFAEHVGDSPGPPLSSYFDRLTTLYEEARFGEHEMSDDQVVESRDLFNQIQMQVNEILRQLNEEEK